jgi:N-acetylglutamate synthase-like GNAT family acetyltransferase
MEIRELTPDDGPACDAIIATLPKFFGHEGGRQDCAHAVRTQRGWVAEDDGDVIGFLTVESSTEETLEITWMAVRNDRRRAGVGRRLVEALVRESKRPILVLTAGPSSPEPDADPDDNYEGTRAFYRKMGFIPVKELTPAGWDQSALLLVRPRGSR